MNASFDIELALQRQHELRDEVAAHRLARSTRRRDSGRWVRRYRRPAETTRPAR